jgi:predicted AlkP superfamily pyrophosphatase or phosphodiesterase
MKKLSCLLFLVLLLQISESSLPAQKAVAPVSMKPKLVVAIILDQFRYDYLLRFEKDYSAGLKRLLKKGAVFANARYEHFPTFTSVGHAAFLTGAYPSSNGIAGNQWYDRQTRKVVGSAADDSVKLVGKEGRIGASPRNLLVSTLGDEIKMADAILSTGHMANGVFWYDSSAGNFISSTYYVKELPAWVKEFNAKKPADRYKGAEWLGTKLSSNADATLYGAIPGSPYGSELIELLAEKAIESEQLGSDPISDLLMLSFSSNDYVGHRYGPDSPQVRDMCIATDRILEKLFRFLDARVGLANITVVLSADHGVAPLPESNVARNMAGGRLSFGAVREAAQKGLSAKFGEGKWVEAVSEDNDIYLNWDLINSKKLSDEEVAHEAANIIGSLPHVFRVYTREQLMNGASLADQVGRRVAHGYFPQRGPDLFVIFDPYYLTAMPLQTTHGTPFGYDTHVPLIFMGPRIKAGNYYGSVAMNDVAPTLSAILGIEMPSGAEGRILSEMFSEAIK